MRSKNKPLPAPKAPEPPVATEPVAEEAAEAQTGYLWKILGGLAVGLGLAVAITVYHHVQGQLGGLKNEVSSLGKDLRGDLSRLSKEYVTMVKKEEVSTRLRNVWDRLKELQGGRTDLTALRERCALLAELHKGGEQERKELAEQVKKLREKGRAAEEKASLVKEMRTIRERIAQLENKPNGDAEEAEKP